MHLISRVSATVYIYIKILLYQNGVFCVLFLLPKAFLLWHNENACGILNATQIKCHCIHALSHGAYYDLLAKFSRIILKRFIGCGEDATNFSFFYWTFHARLLLSEFWERRKSMECWIISNFMHRWRLRLQYPTRQPFWIMNNARFDSVSIQR